MLGVYPGFGWRGPLGYFLTFRGLSYPLAVWLHWWSLLFLPVFVTSFCVCFGVRFRVPGGCVADAGLCAARCSHLTRLRVFGVWI